MNNSLKMGAGISRRSEPEVHVVVVQSQENGQVDAKVVRKTYSNLRSPRVEEGMCIVASKASDAVTLECQCHIFRGSLPCDGCV